MRKTILTIGLVALLVLASAPVALVFARTSTAPAQGEWTWVNETFREMVHRSGSGFLRGDEAGAWTGTFDGESHDDFIGHVSASGELHGMLRVRFENVSVNGAEGGLWMGLSWYVNDEYNFGGRWTILSGSGELQHLRGEGQWLWADDVGPEGGARYSGVVWEQ